MCINISKSQLETIIQDALNEVISIAQVEEDSSDSISQAIKQQSEQIITDVSERAQRRYTHSAVVN